MKLIKIIVISIFVFIFIVLFLAWSDGRDQKIIQAAEAYERCVKEEYNASPAYWYAEYGYYPEC